MVIDITLKEVFPDKSKDNNDVQKPTACSICKSNNVITDPESGEIICSDCGAVISDKMEDPGSNRSRTRYDQNNRSQTGDSGGLPRTLARHDMGLSTVIARTDKDTSGHKIDPFMLSTINRLRKWDFRTQVRTSADRNLRLAFNELDTLKHKLALSDAIIEQTAYIYRKAQESGLVRGRSVSAVLTAALYISCREVGIPKTLREISQANNVTSKVAAKTYRRLVSHLDIKISTLDPVRCIVKVANKAILNEKTKRHAIDIMNNITRREISAGKDPMGLAATVLYISCLDTGEHRTQKDIAQAAGITDVTLRNRFKDLKNKLELN